MCNLVLVISVAALLLIQDGVRAAHIKRAPVKIEMDNHLEPNVIATKTPSSRKFVHITSRPPLNMKRTPGTELTLTCEAMGSPAPTIQWLKNDVPILEYDLENNEILDTNPASLARVTSSLIISAPSHGGQDFYTCIAQAGAKTTAASTTVYTPEPASDSERLRLVRLKPHITVYYKILMDLIGNNVVLPCKVQGGLGTEIYWRDNDNKLISRRNPRMQVLSSGDLIISHLRWSDMGEFTCTVKNAFGKESAATFVYPVRAG